MRSWLEESLEALRQAAEGQAVRRASELRHTVPLSSDSAPDTVADAPEDIPRYAHIAANSLQHRLDHQCWHLPMKQVFFGASMSDVAWIAQKCGLICAHLCRC